MRKLPLHLSRKNQSMIENVEKLSQSGCISSISNLAEALGLSEVQLNDAASLEKKYTVGYRDKTDGSKRKVHNPNKLIRLVQGRIKSRIFRDENIISWGSFLFGSIPNNDGPSKDYIACAQEHCRAKSLLKIDISDFFDNIHSDIVFDIFNNFFKYPKDVSQILTDICTYEGKVPQGGITSSFLASLALYDLEFEVVNRLSKKKLVYTRYVDDITVSSKIADFDFSYAERIIQDMLYKKDLPINSSKTDAQYLGTSGLTVHGLRIHHNTVRLPKDEVKKIRAAVKKIEVLASEPNYRTTFSYRKDFNRCMGRVNKLNRVGHSQADALTRRLKKVSPLPAKRDVQRCKDVLLRLKRDYSQIGHTNTYKIRFYRLHERLNILKRKYPVRSSLIRKELKELAPKDSQ